VEGRRWRLVLGVGGDGGVVLVAKQMNSKSPLRQRVRAQLTITTLHLEEHITFKSSVRKPLGLNRQSRGITLFPARKFQPAGARHVAPKKAPATSNTSYTVVRVTDT
jgi:hypothetical protein